MVSSVAEILEQVFTTPNPKMGSLPPEHTAWVVLAHGTGFYSTPSDMLPCGLHVRCARSGSVPGPERAWTRTGRDRIGRLNPYRLDGWFPEEPVWCIGFAHENIVTIVTMDSEPIAVGLSGRARRELDLAEQSIVLVRGFDGTPRRSE